MPGPSRTGHEVDPATLTAATGPVTNAMDRTTSSEEAVQAAPVSAAAYPRIPNGQELGAAHETAVQTIVESLGALREILGDLVGRLEQTATDYRDSEEAAAATVESATDGGQVAR